MTAAKMRFALLGTAVVVLGLFLGIALWLKLAPTSRPAASIRKPLEGLNRYGVVPHFVLLERSGKKVGLAELRGRIWIADFMYTSCKDTCPLQAAEMANLQEELKNEAGVQLVSISVDPDTDTPTALSLYAKRYQADPNRWLFLTGPKDQISRLVQEGFRLGVAPAGDERTESAVVLHSPRFVLVDQETQIRGYYDSRDPEALRRLRKDVASLRKG